MWYQNVYRPWIWIILFASFGTICVLVMIYEEREMEREREKGTQRVNANDIVKGKNRDKRKYGSHRIRLINTIYMNEPSESIIWMWCTQENKLTIGSTDELRHTQTTPQIRSTSNNMRQRVILFNELTSKYTHTHTLHKHKYKMANRCAYFFSGSVLVV